MRGPENATLLGEDLRVGAALGLAEALGDDVAEFVVDRESGRAQDVCIASAPGQHEVDGGAGSDHVRPLHVGRDLPGPHRLLGAAVERCQAVWRGDREVGGSQAPRCVERLYVGLERGVLKRVDDHDRLPGSGDSALQHRLDAIGDADLVGAVARHRRRVVLARRELDYAVGLDVGQLIRVQVVGDRRDHEMGRVRHDGC